MPSPESKTPPVPPNRPRPWRTEGLPEGQSPTPKRRWNTIVVGLLGYLAVFGVLTLQDRLSNQQVAVLIPELVQRRWYHHLLHNKRAAVLKGLLLKGNQRIVVINVPWYLES